MKNVKIFDSKDFPTYLPRLNALYDDLFTGGKGFRAKLVDRVTGHLKVPDRTVLLLQQTIEFIHNASLLHDDLVDRSTLRRNKPAAWLKYTPEYAVLAGDYLLARVMVNLSSFGNLRLIQYTAEVISDLLEGEWIQDSLVRDWNITLSQLDRVHNLKTGSLFKWCLKAPFIALDRNGKEEQDLLDELGSLLGLLFQRSDDLLDFDIRNDEGKAVLGDLKSGYLNSVSVFLLEGVSAEQKAGFLKAQTLAEVEAALGSEYYQRRLKEFDQMNEAVLDLYSHQVERLKKHLKPGEDGLIADLMPLSKLLYWRRKS